MQVTSGKTVGMRMHAPKASSRGVQGAWRSGDLIGAQWLKHSTPQGGKPALPPLQGYKKGPLAEAFASLAK